MKAKKLYTAILLTMLLTSTFVALYKLCPIVKAAVTERITNGSFEEFYINWTGTGSFYNFPRTGVFSLKLYYDEWMQSDNLGDIPVGDIESFGFYYIYGDETTYTVIYSDGTNSSSIAYYGDDWTYVDVTEILEEGKNVRFIHFHSNNIVYIDDVSLVANGEEKVPNGGFEESVFTGWTNIGAIPSMEEVHSEAQSVRLIEGISWIRQDNLGNIPTERVDSFGFYCIGYYYSAYVTFTIIYSDDSNISDTLWINYYDWDYIDLLPYLSAGKEISSILFSAEESYDDIWIDDVSLMALPWNHYMRPFLIFRSFWVDYAFTFTVSLYIDSLNQTLDTEMRIIKIHEEEEDWGSQTVDVYLYVNSSGAYIHAVGGAFKMPWDDEIPLGSGYYEVSLGEWYTIYYEMLYIEGSDHWSFQVDDNELFSGDTLDYYFAYDRITLGSYGAPDDVSNFTLYYDDVDWTAGAEDFEGTFPGEWTVIGIAGLSTFQYVSPTHSLMVPLLGVPLSVTVNPETAVTNRNTTQTFTTSVEGGTPPYTYKWYVDGAEQEGETASTFDFRAEELGVYEIWCNVTDFAETEAKSNVAVCTVEAGSLEITVSPSSVHISLGEYANVTASVVGGTPPLQYQWYRNETAIGVNSSQYEISGTEWGVGVWSLYCNVTDSTDVENKSNTVLVYIGFGTLNVTISPSDEISSYFGMSTIFTAEVSGGLPPYYYQWFAEWQGHWGIVDGTEETFELIYNQTNINYYAVRLKVYDSSINSGWSNTTIIHVTIPTATLSPVSTPIKKGSSIPLNCSITPSYANYTYFWYANNTLIHESSETSSNTSQHVFTPLISGRYIFYVRIRINATYIVYVNSNTVTITVEERIITLTSNTTSVAVKQSVSLTCQTEAGADQYTYEWFIAGKKRVANVTVNSENNTFIFTPNYTGTYTFAVYVTFKDSTVTRGWSNRIIVYVAPARSITTDPLIQTSVTVDGNTYTTPVLNLSVGLHTITVTNPFPRVGSYQLIFKEWIINGAVYNVAESGCSQTVTVNSTTTIILKFAVGTFQLVGNDSFETGDLSNQECGTIITTRNDGYQFGHYVNVTSVAAYSGDYGMEAYANYVFGYYETGDGRRYSGGFAMAGKSNTLPYVYANFMVKIPSGAGDDGLFALFKGGLGPISYSDCRPEFTTLAIGWSGNTFMVKTVMWYIKIGGLWRTDFRTRTSGSFQFDKWYNVTVLIKESGNDGFYALWVDDVLVSYDMPFQPFYDYWGGYWASGRTDFFGVAITYLGVWVQPNTANPIIYFDNENIYTLNFPEYPFVNVIINAETIGGVPLSDINFTLNNIRFTSPFYNILVPQSSISLLPRTYLTIDGVPHVFLYYEIEASPIVEYTESHLQMDVTGDMIITIVYGTGGAPKTPEITPTLEPEKIKYCFPLSFYLVIVLIFLLGLYLYSRRETWKIAFPLIPVILWLLLTSPCPPWDLYLAIILTIIACVALLSKKKK